MELAAVVVAISLLILTFSNPTIVLVSGNMRIGQLYIWFKLIVADDGGRYVDGILCFRIV